MSLGENIHRLRKERHMSQDDLAELLEVSRQSVSKWENNSATPELEKLMKMSQLFEISLDGLVGNPVPPAKSEKTSSASQGAVGIASGDMISIILLLFGVLIPIVILATSGSHNSSVLMVIGLFIVPPLVTICAALCSPKNVVLFRVYMVYDIIFGLLAAIAGNVFAPLTVIIYVFAVGFWNDRRA